MELVHTVSLFPSEMSFSHTFIRSATRCPARGVGDDDEPALHTVCVLVADDNEVTRITAAQMLTDFGIYHRVVENGRLACAALAEQSYDLLLIDCHMPEMDGFEAVQHLRNAELMHDGADTQARLTIVALTADTSPETNERCMLAGMDGVLHKPLSPDKLDSCLRHYLFGKAAAVNQPDTTPPDSGPPIDMPSVLTRYGNKKKLVKLMFQLFCEQLRHDVAAIERCVRAGAPSQLFLSAHAIKGAATAAGAGALRQIASQLEEKSHSKDLSGAAGDIMRLKSEVRRCAEYLATLDLGPDDGDHDA